MVSHKWLLGEVGLDVLGEMSQKVYALKAIAKMVNVWPVSVI